MRAYAAVAAGISLLLLATFGLANLLEVPVLSDESLDLGPAGAGAAALSLCLLAGDVLLPVPSSAVMLGNGALFGPVGGAALSIAGGVGAASLGFVIGRRGHRLLHRVVPEDQQLRAAATLRRHGVVAIVVTRPIPVLAETVSILAGTVGMPPGRAILAGAVGTVPPAVAYALAGAIAAGFSSLAVVFGGVLTLTLVVWLLDRRRRLRTADVVK